MIVIVVIIIFIINVIITDVLNIYYPKQGLLTKSSIQKIVKRKPGNQKLRSVTGQKLRQATAQRPPCRPRHANILAGSPEARRKRHAKGERIIRKEKCPLTKEGGGWRCLAMPWACARGLPIGHGLQEANEGNRRGD